MSADTPRRIALLRHAKADWPQVSDHDRPLAERGRAEAAAVGLKLAETGITFDLALCSTATRTRETWKVAVQELPHRPKTHYEERLYEASPGELIALLNETPDEVRDLLLIGHNPGMQALAEILSGHAQDDTLARMTRTGFPTGALAVVSFTCPWKTLEPGVGTLLDFWSPKEH